jgi:hypothetical protein
MRSVTFERESLPYEAASGGLFAFNTAIFRRSWWRIGKLSVILGLLPQSSNSLFEFATNIKLRMSLLHGVGDAYQVGLEQWKHTSTANKNAASKGEEQ